MTKLYFLSLFTLVVIYAAAQGRAGTPDSSFGVNSIKVIVTPDSLGSRQVKKLVVLPNDKIVTLLGYPLGGGTGGTLVRNRLNGSVDSSFGVNGVLPVSNMTPFNLAVQKDGNILTAGTGDQTGWVIVNRFLPDGKPDTLFGKAGATAMYIDDTGDALPAAVALPGKWQYRGGRHGCERRRRILWICCPV